MAIAEKQEKRQDANNPSDGKQVAPTKPEMRIRDRIYDVTTFMKKHPGGSVISFQVGTDATDAFDQFHYRSQKAEKILSKLPSRPFDMDNCSEADACFKGTSPEEDALMTDFRKLHADLKLEGMLKASIPHVLYRIAEVVGFFVVGWMALRRGYYWASVGSVSLGMGRAGWLQHEGGHGSLTGNFALDRHLQEIIYAFGSGMSASWWRRAHNRHHAAPQHEGRDVDLDTLPLVAFNISSFSIMGVSLERVRKSILGRVWFRCQAILFTPVICLLVVLFWQIYLHPRNSVRSKNVREVSYLGLRWAGLFSVLMSSGLSFPQAMGYYVAATGLSAAYIFTNFAVSHTHLPTVSSDASSKNWVDYSADHTMNCASHPLTNWWMAYLNFQIEHHLFPQAPQFRHPQISGRVKALFDKHGKQYKVEGYWSALAMTFANLNDVGREVCEGMLG